MARPRKSESLIRHRWDTLYVTDAEREAITKAALDSHTTPGRYLIALHEQRRPALPPDAAPVLMALFRAEAALAQIAARLPAGPGSIDTCTQLVALERAFQTAALPWLKAQAGAS